MSYVSLHNHTHYSNIRLLDAIIKEDALIDRAYKIGLNGVAITDHEVCSSFVRAEKHLAKRQKQNPNDERWQNFKLIRGNEVYLCRDGLDANNFESGKDKYFHFILLAKDEIGNQQIREISSRAWRRSYYKFMRRVPTYYQDLLEILGKNKGHVIGATACLAGQLGTYILEASRYEFSDRDQYNKIYEDIVYWLDAMSQYFDEEDFYLEIQPSKTQEQIYVNKKILELAKTYDLPVIVTTDSHYLTKQDRTIHKAYLNSKEGEREVDAFYASTYLMTQDEITEYLVDYIDEITLQKIFDNTNKIGEKCKNYSITKKLKIPYIPTRQIPQYPLDFVKQIEPYYEYMTKFATSSYPSDRDLMGYLYQFISSNLNPTDTLTKQRLEQIEVELKAFWISSEAQNVRWSAYLLQMADYIDILWNKGDTLVGAGRGSGVGCYILYILGITQIDPTQETAPLYYWRFINPERASVLDIDIDIQGNRRDSAIGALKDVYGKERVIKVATFGTEKARSAILTACLAPNTLINTTNGLKPIEDINSQDKVYSIYGEEQVITPTQRDYTGELYDFNCSGIGLDFSVTHNHQLLVYTNRKKESYGNISNYIRCQLLDKNQNVLGEFLSIKDAAKYYSDNYNGSYSSMYKYKKTNGYSIIELPAIQNNQVQWLTADNIHSTDFLLTPIYNFNQEENSFVFSKQEQNPYNKKCNYIKEKIEINEELAELIGIYLAEGNINHNLRGITFTIHQKEISLRERIIFLLQQCFGITENSITLINKKDSKGLSIQVNSTPLGRWFNSNCVGLANEKRVPKQLMNSSLSCQKRVVYGCFYGDGYGRVRSNGSYEAKITSVSYGLIQDLWQISARNGYNCSVITEERVNKQTVYNLMFYGLTAESLYESKYNNNIIYDWEYQEPIIFENIRYYKIRINKITKNKYNGNVYCLETKSHNYLLNNIVSHNCRGLGVDVDIAQYLSSMIKSERGIQHTLKETFYGDPEKEIIPNKQFVEEMTNNYPHVWEVAQSIEGLVCRNGQHSGGVIIVDEDFTDCSAIMTTTKGEIVSQFELHDEEELSHIKIDLLVVEALDKIRTCLDLLLEYGYVEPKSSLKDTYESVVGVYNLDRDDPAMWELVWDNKIISLFQMEKSSGIQGISLTKPQSLEDLATLNSVIRLMAQERGAEQPLNKYARFRENPSEWIREMQQAGLSNDEQKLLKKFLGYEYGICAVQEDIMSLVQHPAIGGFSLTWADKLRKSIAKKKPEEFNQLSIEFFENAKKKKLSNALITYVWETLIKTQRGYGFNLSHTLAYSIIGLQEMNLAYKYPILFWNAANLIVDSGGQDGTEFSAWSEEDDGDNRATNFVIDLTNLDDGKDISDEDDDEENKKENKTVNYGKISSAIGRMQSYGVSILPPDINKSKYTFTPDVEQNAILFGIKGITRIGDQMVEDIIKNRPYSSIIDLQNKLKVNRLHVISLIKSGAFDRIEQKPRQQILFEYLGSLADTKQRLTLQNMQMLIRENLIPPEYDFYRRLFNFNKHLKTFKKGEYYLLDLKAMGFYEQHYDIDILSNIDGEFAILQKEWDKIYKKAMDPMRDYLKDPTNNILNTLNYNLIEAELDKYAKGTISKWEMDSISFYYHEHELAHVDESEYDIRNFFEEPEEGRILKTVEWKGKPFPIYDIYRIAGTVLDKDPQKNTVTLLTTHGVVNVKVWQAQFVKYNKQVSHKLPTGKKQIVEKSWFSRGNKLLVTGYRRGDMFVPKIYSNHTYDHPFDLIVGLTDDNRLILQGERMQ